MSWPGWSPGGRRQRACGLSACAIAPSCALPIALVAVSLLVRPGIAVAGGSGTLTFTPLSGPPGTQVTVTISAEPPSPTPYVLSVSPTDPASNACADGLRVADAPKIVVMPGQSTTTTFFWPTDLSSGAYYLCASPAGGQTGPIVWSQQPFSVSGGTPTGPPSIAPGTAVVAQVPNGGVTPGDAVTLTVDTAALDGAMPQAFTLLQPGQSGGVQVNWVEDSPNGAFFTYTVSIPVDTPPGAYAVRVTTTDGSIVATSNTFQIVATSARGGPQRPSSPPIVSVPGTSAISPFGALLVAVIALLLALAVASLAAPLLRRWHHGAHTPDDPTR